MSDELNTLELKDFLELVDGILEGIESGVIKANPLAPLKDIPHIDSINKKEEEVSVSELVNEEQEVKEVKNSLELMGPISKSDIFGKVMDPEKVVAVTEPDGVSMYFGNYSSAAKAMGIGPAKAKKLSDNGLTDESLNVWSLISIL